MGLSVRTGNFPNPFDLVGIVNAGGPTKTGAGRAFTTATDTIKENR